VWVVQERERERERKVKIPLMTRTAKKALIVQYLMKPFIGFSTRALQVKIKSETVWYISHTKFSML